MQGETPRVTVIPAIKTVALDSNDASLPNMPAVHLGNSTTAPGPGLFEVTTFIDCAHNLANADLNWAQTGASYIVFHYPATFLYSDWNEYAEDWSDCTDTQYPYQFTAWGGQFGLNDSPDNACAMPSQTTIYGTGTTSDGGNRQDQFADAFLYSAGTAHCIHVPVFQVRWNWSATWHLGSGVWNLDAKASQVSHSAYGSTWPSWNDNFVPPRWQAGDD
jgi:hypothetical protein